MAVSNSDALYEFTQRFLAVFNCCGNDRKEINTAYRSLPTAHGSSPQILLKQGLIDAQEFDFLLRFPVEPSRVSPVSFLSAHAWGAIKVQSRLLTFVI